MQKRAGAFLVSPDEDDAAYFDGLGNISGRVGGFPSLGDSISGWHVGLFSAKY